MWYSYGMDAVSPLAWWIFVSLVLVGGLAALGFVGRRETGAWHTDRRHDQRRYDERREAAERRSAARVKHDEIHNRDRRMAERRENERRSSRDWRSEFERVKKKVENVQQDNRNA